MVLKWLHSERFLHGVCLKNYNTNTNTIIAALVLKSFKIVMPLHGLAVRFDVWFDNSFDVLLDVFLDVLLDVLLDVFLDVLLDS